MASALKSPISTKGTLQFQFPAAIGYLRIMSRFPAKGGNAIYFSRLKNVITAGVEEYEKARLAIVREHAKCKPLPADAKPDAEAEIVQENGQAVFLDDINRELCKQELEALQEEVPIVVDINHPNLKNAAEKVLKLLSGADCPPILGPGPDGQPIDDSWAHERIVEELILALDRKSEEV